jgi:hypothetical protein
MSLSSDVRDALTRPQGMRDFGENHPVLLTLGAAAGFLAAFLLVSRYLFAML